MSTEHDWIQRWPSVVSYKCRKCGGSLNGWKPEDLPEDQRTCRGYRDPDRPEYPRLSSHDSWKILKTAAILATRKETK